MNLFDTLKQLLPRGGTITTPTVRADVPVDGAVLHVPAMLSADVSWDGENLIVNPVGLEATQQREFWLAKADIRVKVVSLNLSPNGGIFGTWARRWTSGRFKIVDAGDA